MSEIEENDHSEDDIGQNEIKIKEEYELWRKNCRYMYEFVSETALTWPSITVQWLPDHKENKEEGIIDSKLLLGTHTSGQDTNYLKLASTQIPSFPKSDIAKLDEPRKATTKLKITRKFENNYEINRARYMYQQPNIVATINGMGEIDLYDLDGDYKESISHFTPHEANGYGISWNPFTEGYLLSSSDDRTIVLTDTQKLLSGTDDCQVFKTIAHDDIINDVKWHSLDKNLYGSVSDDKTLFLFDARSPKNAVSSFYSPNSDGINTLSFSPFSRNLVAVGNANSNISLLDIRSLTASTKSEKGLLHTMMGHSDSITNLEFSPHTDGIIASGAQDRRVIIWDIFKIGEEQTQEDAEDGCPELFMMHAGHTGAVTDLSWCPYKNWTLASVADDNIVHLWELSNELLESEKGIDIPDQALE